MQTGKIRALITEGRAPFALCLLVVVCLALIEFRHPYFFLQDDNRDYFLPCYVHNIRALLGGEFPLFNFHQHLGIPVTIQYSTLYPPNYAAALCSRMALGHYFGTMEFLAFFHLPLAALGFRRLMRDFGLGEAACCFGALAWTFCGFVMTSSNSWIHMAATAALLPWILLYSIRLSNMFTPGSFLMLVVLKSLFLLGGYQQIFAYMVLFEFLLIALMQLLVQPDQPSDISPGRMERFRERLSGMVRNLKYVFLNYVCVSIVCAPFLLQSIQQVTNSAQRQQAFDWNVYASGSYNIGYWLHGLLLPFDRVGLRVWPEQDFLSHIGYLPLLFIVSAIVLRKDRLRFKIMVVFLVLALFSFLWSADIVISKLFYHIPVYNRFRLPFKLQFFTSFFLIIVSAFGFNALHELLRERWCSKRATGLAVMLVLLLQAVAIVSLFGFLPQRTFNRHDDPVPLVEPLANDLSNGRIVSVGLDVVTDGQHTLWGYSAPSLGFNYATLWGLQHFGGYDALLPEKNYLATLKSNYRSDFNVAPGDVLDVQALVPLEHFRVWGVRWYVVDRNIPLINTGSLRQVYEDRFRRVFTDPGPRPMAGWDDGSGDRGVRYGFTTNSMMAETDRDTDGTLLLNVLYNPWFSAVIDGASVPFSETADAQVAVAVPAGRHEVRLTYTDTYFKYGLVVSCAGIALMILFCVMKRRVRV